MALADEYLKSYDIGGITYKFVTNVDPKPAYVYGLMKCHKENIPIRIIARGCNSCRKFVTMGYKDQLKSLANT